MLATFTTTGSGLGGHPQRVLAQGAGEAPDDDRVLLAVLARPQQPLAEVRVDGRVGAARRRAGQRERRGPHPLAADQQLGARGDERAVATTDAEDEAGREALAQDAEDRGGVVVARRVHLHFAGEHDLVQRPRPDALDAARDGALVVLGRHRALDRERADRVRIQSGSSAAASSVARRACSRSRTASASSPARTSAATVRRSSPPRRASAISGTCSDAGAKPRQCASRRPRRREGEAADGDEAAAGAGVGRVAVRRRAEGAPATRRRARSAPGRAPRAPSRSRARRAPRRHGRAARGRTTARPLPGARRPPPTDRRRARAARSPRRGRPRPWSARGRPPR